jgi:hypothetical protein
MLSVHFNDFSESGMGVIHTHQTCHQVTLTYFLQSCCLVSRGEIEQFKNNPKQLPVENNKNCGELRSIGN